MNHQPNDPLEQRLRRTLHMHLDPLAKQRSAHAANDQAAAILARMRAQTMQKIPLNLVAVASAILLVLFMLTGIPQLLPEQSKPQPTQAHPLAKTGTVEPAPTQAESSLTAIGPVLYRAPSNGGTDLFLIDEVGLILVNLTNRGEEIASFTWSPDGEWIAYSRAAGGQEEIFVMDSTGGQVTQLTTTPGMLWRELAWSADGDWIAATGAHADRPEDSWLYLIPVNGGGAYKLSSYPGARFPAWSPKEDDHVLFSVPDRFGPPAMMIHVVSQANSIAELVPPTKTMSFEPGRDWPYAWSPDGALAYVEQSPIQADGSFASNATAQLLLRPADDIFGQEGIPQVLVVGLPAGQVQSLSWSPDGRTIALTVANAQSGCLTLQLVATRPAGHVSAFPDLCLAESSAPAWTHDGRLLLVERSANAAPRVIVFDASSTPAGTIIPLSIIDSAARDLKVQPRGKSLRLQPKAAAPQPAALPPSPIHEAPGTLWFATADLDFDGGSDGQYQVFTSRPDGSQINLVADIPLYGAGGALSPDGSLATFLSSGSNFPPLVIAKLDGSAEHKRLEMKQADRPVWSPDGKQIALISAGDENEGMLDQLILVNAATTDTRTIPLTGNASPSLLAWSPDGRKIALAISTRTSGSRWHYLYLLDPQKSTGDQADLIPLTQSADGGIVDLAWSPDGQQIAFLSNDPDYRYTELHLVNADGTGKRTLARPAFLDPRLMSITRLAWSPDSRYLSMITFEKTGSVTDTHITLANVQSGETFILPKSSDEQIMDMTWSPDGRWLVYKTDLGIFVIDIPGAISGSFGPVLVSDRTDIDILKWRP